MENWLGYVLSLVMGISLGLFGGGGSILTVPILVYLIGIEPVIATGYSLFVVGSTAVVGIVQKSAKKLVAWKTGIIFAIPSLIAVFLTRYKLVPMIPDTLFTLGNEVITKDIAIMIFFGLVMLLASYSMIRGRKSDADIERPTEPKIGLLIIEGLVVGVVTGLVGAGGGFLIVPALVMLVGLDMKLAVGTSLLIIAIKSLIGFIGDIIGSEHAIEWQFLLLFTLFSIIGMIIGSALTHKIHADKIKKGFGWFILAMGIFIVLKETVL